MSLQQVIMDAMTNDKWGVSRNMGISNQTPIQWDPYSDYKCGPQNRAKNTRILDIRTPGKAP